MTLIDGQDGRVNPFYFSRKKGIHYLCIKKLFALYKGVEDNPKEGQGERYMDELHSFAIN